LFSCSSHSITADLSIEETAEAAQFFGSDAIILTGSATGKEVDSNELGSKLRYISTVED